MLKKPYSLTYYPSCCAKRLNTGDCKCKQVETIFYAYTYKEILEAQKRVGGVIKHEPQ